jgi:hypothetical protein
MRIIDRSAIDKNERKEECVAAEERTGGGRVSDERVKRATTLWWMSKLVMGKFFGTGPRDIFKKAHW